MNADKSRLIELMFDNKRQYQIPVYQRNYDWEKDNCLELFNDVLNSYENEKIHFLGTIVQVQQDEEGGLKHFIIVDGQQRMTSIYLLLKALYDKTSDESTHNELEGLLFNASASRDFDKQEKNKLKLKPIKSDNEQFLLLMNNKFESMNKSSNIYLNYTYFCDLIDEATRNNEISTKNILSGLKRLEIVMISLKEPDDNPQVIFERINSTGEDLKLADLIRNYLLMTDSNMEHLFEEYWSPMEATLGKNEINKYFITYILFKTGEVKEDKAYQQFKKWADAIGTSHEDLLKDIVRYSSYYAAFVGINNKYSNETQNYLSAFSHLKQTTIFPFLFNIFDDYEDKIIDEEVLNKILLFYLNYSIRRMACNVPSNSLRGLYRTLYKRIFKDGKKDDYLNKIYSFMAIDLSNTKDSMPNNTTLKQSLLTDNLYKNKSLCKYLLTILENGISSLKEKVEISDGVTIEHIMPQNKNNVEWRKEIGANYDYIYEKYVHTLGNLTLSGYNSELSDNPFVAKVELLKKSKFVYLNEDITNKATWSEKEICDRANRLSDKLLSDLALPDVFGKKITDVISNKAYRVDSFEDFTGKRPISFIFCGTSKDVQNSTDMLVQFVELLYEFDKQKLQAMASRDWKSDNSSKPFISFDKDKLRNAKEINNSGIFIETNRSTNDIVRIIKYLISEFDFDYDDFIFYVDDSYN